MAGSTRVLVAMLVPALCVAQGLPTIKSAASASAFGALPTISPGSWIEIYGSNLAIDTRSWTASDFFGINAPYSLDGTRVYVGGQPACIDYISTGQVNAQVSSYPFAGTQQIVVSTPGGTSAPYSINVNTTAPGLLAPASFNVGGIQYIAALFADGATYVLPPGAIAGVPSRRAQPGDTITLYGVGFGGYSACQIVEQSNMGGSPLQVQFGPASGTVTYDGLAPGAVGLYQINVIVPPVQTSDSVPLTFTLGGAAGMQTLYIAVQNDNPTPQVASLTLSTIFAAGGGTLQGTVTLSTAAPSGGAVVGLTSNNNAASIPSSITVPAGATSDTFTISAATGSYVQLVEVTASAGGASAQSWFEITSPTGAVSISIEPNFSISESTGLTIQTTGTIDFDSISQPGSNRVGAAFMSGAVITFSTAFNDVTFSGLTMNFSQPAASGVMNLAPGGPTAITGGSVSLIFSSSDQIGNGTVTGALTITSSSVTLTGTITGTYSLIL